MILTCAIIDDEPLAVDLLASYAKNTPTLELVGTYTSAISAIKKLREEPVDILFLDIQMPELSGLEFAMVLPKSTKVIFTTAYNQYALESYKVNSIDYLIKPITYEMFLKSVEKAMNYFEEIRKNDILSEEQAIYVKSDYKLLRISLDDILYVEGLKDYVSIHVESKKEPIPSLINMKRIMDFLPSPAFMRVHRSYIVNMKKIQSIDRNRIVIGDQFIPISESYKEEVYGYINKHTVL